MRYTVLLFLLLGLTSSTFSQDRQKALADFNEMKLKAAALERAVLAPEESDKVAAAQRSAMAVRIMPRETYDNSFSSIRGGGAYYGIYYRMHDYSYGCELGWERGRLSVCTSDFAAMTDLGEISLDQVTTNNQSVIDLGSYKNSSERQSTRTGELIGQTSVVGYLNPVVGHTYLIRSIRTGYYDILAAFTVSRQDTDNSLILLSKILQQNDPPRRAGDKVADSDEQIRVRAQSWLRDERFKGIVVNVSNRVVTLTGSVDGQFVAYAIQLSNGLGASKTINLLEPR